MSNPTPAPPASPGPSPAVQWTVVATLVLSLLAGVVQRCIPEQQQTTTVVAPAAPVAKTEAAYVFDDKGERTTNPDIEAVATKLKPGRWSAMLVPEAGGTLQNLRITIESTDAPLPPVVVTPPVVTPPVVTPPVVEPPAPTVKPTAATYVYEKDSGGVPSPVMVGLNKVNRDSGFKIIASVFEDDATDGTGDVPEQYRVALKAAHDAGLPALVVTADSVVLKVVKAPTTEQQITEAVQ